MFTGILLIIALDFLALDDIATGNEPFLLEEYAILLISTLTFGYLGFSFLKRRR